MFSLQTQVRQISNYNRVLLVWCSILIIVSSLSPSPALAQTKCQPPAPPPNPANLFSEEQEMMLGDVVAEQMESDFKIIDDESVVGNLRRIGDRLLAGAPPTHLRFQFFVVDSYEVNAFTLPGGRIYVTRKLIAFAKNEDELAGVIAHELGHVLARHLANDMSSLWRDALGVSQVTDRRDIYEKYQTLIDTIMLKPKVGEKGQREERDQYTADMIGLYLLTGAGYDAQAQAGFWDRYQDTKGKTGSFFSKLFGTAKPEQKRLGEMLRQLGQLPAECRKQSIQSDQAEFSKWQRTVVGYKRFGRGVAMPGLTKRIKLTPALRSTVYHMRFSLDGKYLLAQDDAGISVMTRTPFASLFRISAPNAYPAQFTPDSRQIVLYTPNLRVETWDLADQSLSSADEVVLRGSCLQTRLAPDGRTLACLDENASVILFSVKDGSTVFEKKSFTTPDFYELLVRVEEIFTTRGRVPDEGDFINMMFSPDARYFMAGDHSYRYGAFSTVAQNNALAFDVHDRVPLQINNDLKQLAIGGFAFVGADTIVGRHWADAKKSGSYSFPAGAQIQQFEVPHVHFDLVSKGDYVLIDGDGPYRGSVFDLGSKKFMRPGQEVLRDVFDNIGAAETPSGEVALYDLKNQGAPSILPIPENPLGRVYAAALSDDFKYLAVSGSARGAVWNVADGKMLTYIRGFRSASFAADDRVYMDFPASSETPRSVAHFDPDKKEMERDVEIKSNRVTQYGDVLIRTRPRVEMKNGKEVFDWQNGLLTLEVYDAKTYTLLWSQEYPQGFPSYVPDGLFGTMILGWWGNSKMVAAEVKTDADLARRIGNLKDADDKYYFRIVDLRSGKAAGSIVVPTNKRSFKIVDAVASGDYLVAMDDHNRGLVYSISKGKLLGHVFGSRATLSPTAALLCVENESGQLNLYDLNTLEKRGQISLGDRVKMVRFSSDGKRLAVLTANQILSTFDVAGATAH